MLSGVFFFFFFSQILQDYAKTPGSHISELEENYSPQITVWLTEITVLREIWYTYHLDFKTTWWSSQILANYFTEHVHEAQSWIL